MIDASTGEEEMSGEEDKENRKGEIREAGKQIWRRLYKVMAGQTDERSSRRAEGRSQVEEISSEQDKEKGATDGENRLRNHGEQKDEDEGEQMPVTDDEENHNIADGRAGTQEMDEQAGNGEKKIGRGHDAVEMKK